MPSYAAVIFDLDGVLVHSTPLHDRAYREVLAGYGITDFDYQPFAGRKTLDVMRILNEKHHLGLDEEGVREAAQRKTAAAIEYLRRDNPIAKGAAELLNALHGRRKLGLASSASPQSIAVFLETNDLLSHFDCVLSSADVREAKPAPEIYLAACARLGVVTAQAAIVEDAVAGMWAGVAAGAAVYGVSGTYPEADLLAAGALACVSRLPDLLHLVCE